MIVALRSSRQVTGRGDRTRRAPQHGRPVFFLTCEQTLAYDLSALRQADTLHNLVIVRQHRRVRFLVPESGRSEEHTSELQPLMRISYAVFSFNKKKTQP